VNAPVNYAAGIAVVSQSAELTMAYALTMVDAVAQQVIEDFAPAWGLIPCVPALFARIQDVPPGVPTILMLDAGDVPGAAGWHTEDANGRISGVVVVGGLLAAGWTLFDGAQSIQACLSHEVLEASKNPFVNFWVDMPDGGQDAFEMCDRVQGCVYSKGSGSLSNFLTRHAFNDSPPDGAKFDHMEVLSAPFEIAPGGYASRRTAGGQPIQVGLMPLERRHPLGRSAHLAA